jgi:hypothetical protein
MACRLFIVRFLPVALVATTLVFGFPFAAGEGDDSQGGLIVEDSRGDVSFQIGSSSQTAPISSDSVDLLRAWISNETVDDIEFGAQVAAWDSGDAFTERRRVSWTFKFGERMHEIRSPFGAVASDCEPEEAALYRSETSSRVFQVQCLGDPIVDRTAASVRVVVPKALIANERDVLWTAGTAISEIRVQVSSGATVLGQPAATIAAFDIAPNDAPAGPYIAQVADAQAGHIFLVSDQARRVSNGESTTFVFPIRLLNVGDAEDTVHLRVETSYPEWTIKLPVRIRAPSQMETPFPAIVTLNFTHDHGTDQTFRIIAESTLVPESKANLELGVHWLTIPQPAGHHDRLWLHSRPFPPEQCDFGVCAVAPQITWTSTLATDPTAGTTDEDAAGAPPATLVQPVALWAFPLAPQLYVGLHLDKQRVGEFVGSLRSTMPSPAANLEATLYLCDRLGEPSEYACQSGMPGKALLRGSTELGALAANAQKTFDFELDHVSDDEVIPWKNATNLELGLKLTTPNPQGVATVYKEPSVMLRVKDSVLSLPLFEYHDPLDQAFEHIGAVELKAMGPFEKAINPGNGALFNFDVKNSGPSAIDLRVLLEGYNADWASVEPTNLEIQAGRVNALQVRVDVPMDASPGERAELFVIVEGAVDPTVVALSRLRATVVDPVEQSIPNELVETSADGSGTPGFAFGTIIMGLGVGLLRRPRSLE